jgi:hypothetical protein
VAAELAKAEAAFVLVHPLPRAAAAPLPSQRVLVRVLKLVECVGEQFCPAARKVENEHPVQSKDRARHLAVSV